MERCRSLLVSGTASAAVASAVGEAAERPVTSGSGEDQGNHQGESSRAPASSPDDRGGDHSGSGD